jgi:hypothetical protein
VEERVALLRNLLIGWGALRWDHRAMSSQPKCTNCGSAIELLGMKAFHEGDAKLGPIKIGVSSMFTPRFEVEVFVCTRCRHLEFFLPGGEEFPG